MTIRLPHWLAALMLIGSIVSPPAMATELNVVHSGKWPPYADAGLPGQGLAVELVTTALKKAGYETFMRIDSLDRILAMDSPRSSRSTGVLSMRVKWSANSDMLPPANWIATLPSRVSWARFATPEDSPFRV